MLKKATFTIVVDQPGVYDIEVNPDRLSVVPKEFARPQRFAIELDALLKDLRNLACLVSQRGPTDSLFQTANELIPTVNEFLGYYGRPPHAFEADDARCL